MELADQLDDDDAVAASAPTNSTPALSAATTTTRRNVDFRLDSVEGGVDDSWDSKVEQITKEPLISTATITAATTLMATMVISAAVSIIRMSRQRTCAAVNNLVEFAAVQPHATTLWTVVDLNVGSVGDQQISTVNRAFHHDSP